MQDNIARRVEELRQLPEEHGQHQKQEREASLSPSSAAVLGAARVLVVLSALVIAVIFLVSVRGVLEPSPPETIRQACEKRFRTEQEIFECEFIVTGRRVLEAQDAADRAKARKIEDAFRASR